MQGEQQASPASDLRLQKHPVYCRHGHTCEIIKTVYEKYQVGDRIRRYESTFGKDATVRLNCYTEGVIEKSYPSLIDWLFDYRIDKCMRNGTEIKAPA